ncbi:MAG: type II toxin-antitoxin system RelB/DinJ family antitoxin [Bacteroidaceae bacterium]|nr:type II toxin-antitoxin system RelB/DinJ family antitoxin [Bacteroidaceae bacterium]
MAQVSMTVRMDFGLKASFDALCSEFGMSANTAMNVFAKAVVMYRKIPFEIKASARGEASSRLSSAFYALREEAKKNGIQDLPLEDVNEEIRQARSEMVAKAASDDLCRN